MVDDVNIAETAESKASAEALDRARLARERREAEQRKRLDELRAHAAAAQAQREKRDEERRKRQAEQRARDDDRRVQVEERKRAIWEASVSRREALLQRERERTERLERARAARSSPRSAFAFGSSTPRLLEPLDSAGFFWAARSTNPIDQMNFFESLAASTTNVMFASAPLTRRASALHLDSDNDNKASIGLRMFTSFYEPDRQPPVAMWSSVARRRTDLVPTLPAPRAPGRAYSMTRLDKLPSRPLSGSPSMHHLNRTQPRSGDTTPGSRPASALSNAAPVLRQRPARKPRPASIAGTGVNTPRGGVDTNSQSAATTPSVSRDSTVMAAAVPRRAQTTPRRPRPASLHASRPATAASTPIAPGEGKPPVHRKPKPSKEHPNRKSMSASPGRALSPSPAHSKEPSQDKEIVKQKPSDKNHVDAHEVSQKLEALQIQNGNENARQPLHDKVNENKENLNINIVNPPVAVNKVEEAKPEIVEVQKPVEVQKVEDNKQIVDEMKEIVEQKVEKIAEKVEKVEQIIEKPEEKKEIVVEKKVEEKKEKSDEKKVEEKKEPSQEKAEENEMTASMISRRITTEEEAKAALAERRRRAREELERQAELERQRLQREAEEEAETQRLEEERQRREEEEAKELARLQRAEQEEKLRKAIEAQQQLEREEAERKAREEAERAARVAEENEKRRQAEEAERLRREELERTERERVARRQRVEAIMARTRLRKVGRRRVCQHRHMTRGSRPSGSGARSSSAPSASVSRAASASRPSWRAPGSGRQQAERLRREELERTERERVARRQRVEAIMARTRLRKTHDERQQAERLRREELERTERERVARRQRVEAIMARTRLRKVGRRRVCRDRHMTRGSRPSKWQQQEAQEGRQTLLLRCVDTKEYDMLTRRSGSGARNYRAEEDKKQQEEKEQQQAGTDNGNADHSAPEAPQQDSESTAAAEEAAPAPAPPAAANNGNVAPDLLDLSDPHPIEDKSQEQPTAKIASNDNAHAAPSTNNGNAASLAHISASFLQGERGAEPSAKAAPDAFDDDFSAHNGHAARPHPLTLQNAI
ncbi:calponin homology domain-containing protein DDB_G0272472 [Cydia pomonella]|uniref:calponin homology domain-containing protein DDB_G0272472 n=1 Tax=Cydia pomonella TaxID=82600 RepID=UPI002ADDA7E1|nr:calponin homology domain-containing protein DDB_G0272472 [Cydia pomonella]